MWYWLGWNRKVKSLINLYKGTANVEFDNLESAQKAKNDYDGTL